MNNAYKAEEEKLIPFKTYLLKEEKISESTASDYIKRIITICKENEIDVEHLQTNIDQICFDYTQGSKKDLEHQTGILGCLTAEMKVLFTLYVINV